MRQLVCAVALLVAAPAFAQPDNLLRNGEFQDDWSTHLPELKNHHWNYSTEVYNRRDYNPDGWRLSGKWEWRNADAPRGQRKLVMSSGSRAVQSVNWVTINNSAKLEGWPDAGGFPGAEGVRVKKPVQHATQFVRDLIFRVKLSGKDVPKDGVKLTVAWSAASPIDDPLGDKRIVSKSVAVPAGTYAEKTVEVILSPDEWLAVAQKDPLAAAQGPLVPMAAVCEIVYADKQPGSVELLGAVLRTPGPTGWSLLQNGNFEAVKDNWPVGWSKPQKYRYFPPGVYYIFNTWHNSNSENRGKTELDSLVPHGSKNSLRMNLPSGDEVFVASDPIPLNQTEPRVLEFLGWVKTDQLAMFQIDAEDENGKRIDGFNFIHKAMPSVGTDDWRFVRQVFRPSAPLKSIRIKLCARGTNGYTLGGTGLQPQQNATGTIWWDDLQLSELELTEAEAKARGVKQAPPGGPASGPHLEKLDLGEALIGRNDITAEIVNPTDKPGTFKLRLTRLVGQSTTNEFSEPITVGARDRKPVRISTFWEVRPQAYSDQSLELTLIETTQGKDDFVAESRLRSSTWTTPIDLELGALYLRPEQKLFVRVNLGLSATEMRNVKELRLEVLRRGTNEVLKTVIVPATPADIAKQRTKIPDGLREDFRNLLLSDIDVSFLPVQPFADPQRNWVIRATVPVVDAKRRDNWTVTSPPFCRLAHDGAQPPITSVKINEHGDFLVNEKPWMPWGVTYGHNPVYDGPVESGKYHDLANLKPWGLYDRHGGNLADRALWDGNCVRHVEGPVIRQPQLEELWKKGLYTSTAFVAPPTAKNPWPDDHLKYLRTAPMVAAVSRGPEEAFGYFFPMTQQQLDSVKAEADYLRKATGKPVMVGHGGYWTRLELERVPFFDIYDPETEPWYPAPVHTDLAPLFPGKPKAMWLRPQMYEGVPFERWRYHVYVELMRGVRGWQVAHGPGDASTFRGLHGELKYLQPAIYSKDKPPAVTVAPGIEHMVRSVGGKTTVIAATTHGMSFGNWKWDEAHDSKAGRARVTADPHIFRDESDGYHAAGDPAAQKLVPHGIQYLPNARSWPKGSKLVTWVKIDGLNKPWSVVALVKVDGRWTQAVAWGNFDAKSLRTDNARAFWFLRTFYRHARGFLGWGDKVGPEAMALVPEKIVPMVDTIGGVDWVKLEVPLDRMDATGKLLDGVGFLHDGGRMWWANTKLVAPDGTETVVFGDHEDRPAPDPTIQVKTKITVAGLKKGTKIRVLFEDREIVAEDGYFVDDFRGVDLYQRYGGERTAYGNAPVALHLYEFPNP